MVTGNGRFIGHIAATRLKFFDAIASSANRKENTTFCECLLTVTHLAKKGRKGGAPGGDGVKKAFSVRFG